jgi:hypothetical protein
MDSDSFNSLECSILNLCYILCNSIIHKANIFYILSILLFTKQICKIIFLLFLKQVLMLEESYYPILDLIRNCRLRGEMLLT